MRIRIAHETTFAYAPPARSVIQNLRLTPRSHDSQYVMRWRVTADIDGLLRQSEDSLGNIVHSFTYQRPVERFTVATSGEVETSDAVGVVKGSVETLPPAMFLRASAHAQANGALREFASSAVAGVSDPLDRLHLVMGALHREIAFDPEAEAPGDVAEALALKRGGAADFALAFIAIARWLDVPARFVSGFRLPREGETVNGLSAWAEAHTPGLGWVAFDCVADLCPDASYVRVAVGFDHLGAAAFRGSHGGGEESATQTLRIEQAQGQSQN